MRVWWKKPCLALGSDPCGRTVPSCTPHRIFAWFCGRAQTRRDRKMDLAAKILPRPVLPGSARSGMSGMSGGRDGRLSQSATRPRRIRTMTIARLRGTWPERTCAMSVVRGRGFGKIASVPVCAPAPFVPFRCKLNLLARPRVDLLGRACPRAPSFNITGWGLEIIDRTPDAWQR